MTTASSLGLKQMLQSELHVGMLYTSKFNMRIDEELSMLMISRFNYGYHIDTRVHAGDPLLLIESHAHIDDFPSFHLSIVLYQDMLLYINAMFIEPLH